MGEAPRIVRLLGALVAPLVAALALAACASGSQPVLTRAELTNPALGIDYAPWLIGPIAAMATPEEVGTYLSLRSDAEAKDFIEGFWRKRQPSVNSSTNEALETYKRRCDAADRQFTEGGLPGQRTDRGTVFVLYGPPQESQFQISPAPQDPAIEVWVYPADAPPGLDGKRPSRFYRFIKRGDVTVTYRPVTPRPRPFSPN
jgi:GWxTD domain-containing protein